MHLEVLTSSNDLTKRPLIVSQPKSTRFAFNTEAIKLTHLSINDKISIAKSPDGHIFLYKDNDNPEAIFLTEWNKGTKHYKCTMLSFCCSKLKKILDSNLTNKNGIRLIIIDTLIHNNKKLFKLHLQKVK